MPRRKSKKEESFGDPPTYSLEDSPASLFPSPEMFKLIEMLKPRWVLAENVSRILTIEDGMLVESVSADLECAGYTVPTFIVPAVAVGAWHRRDRVWFVANSNSSPFQCRNNKTTKRRKRQIKRIFHSES